MKRYDGYLIDLDGTMYLGNERIDAAAEFVAALHKKNIPYMFLTNNSSKTQSQISEKLNKMEIISTPDHVFTSSMATAKYIKHNKENAKCYMIGEKGLADALEKEGLIVTEENCDYVVIGIDRDVNYEKLATACLAIRNGAEFISTNGDIAIPTERGLVPGNGAITSAITVSTGIEPTFVGKPETIIMDEAMNTLGLDKEKILMVGDNYNTDILAGINTGVDTLMVFTGVTPYEDYPKLKHKPTYFVHNLKDWIHNIK
ncbi:TIGR01457 family HAD-type hydrolase [Virgibacillus oceani]|uniref:Acid sugar phosphatase n=1 Tax=Virgibacillus oceani TaxID=1479511 RepID=A0A917LYZ3_9BACI|nr:TIGR01457 family HAD-type hydrolase [Virgibacillus oceani]GGG66399.1 haloacid dehalogenase [Virgibacillus oceani]